jgi:hypothetical protein
MKTFGEQAAMYLSHLEVPSGLPAGVDVLKPFCEIAVQELIHAFYDRYFSDSNSRTFLFGINPGRFGSGLTGIGFTDPVILNRLGFTNSLVQRSELSASYVYELIDFMGGPKRFYQDFYITAVSPVGYVKNGKNINYYDQPDLEDALTPYIISQMEEQLHFGAKDVAVSVGKGKNIKFLEKLNKTHGWFKRIENIPHPRWVMQYRRKQKEEIIKSSADLLLRLR